jgi:hypothetical protein
MGLVEFYVRWDDEYITTSTGSKEWDVNLVTLSKFCCTSTSKQWQQQLTTMWQVSVGQLGYDYKYRISISIPFGDVITLAIMFKKAANKNQTLPFREFLYLI